MNFSELLKASKGLPVDDMIAALWGKKIYDANEWQITTLTGSLPLTYESRIEHVLKNYALYGSASGAGEETENLFDKNAKDTNNGYLVDAALLDTGAIAEDNKWDVTEYISVDSSTQYVFSNMVGVAAAICWYDSNKNYISGTKVNATSGGYVNKSLTSPATASYTRFSLLKVSSGSGTLHFDPNVDVAMLTPGSAAPSSYIPYGFKIPLTNTGENSQSETYPLYIGSSKLGEDEYLDYQEQKIYKDKTSASVSKVRPGDTFTVENLGAGAYRVYHESSTVSNEAIKIGTNVPANTTASLSFKIKIDVLNADGPLLCMRDASNNHIISSTVTKITSIGEHQINVEYTTTSECFFSILGNRETVGESYGYDYTISDIVKFNNVQTPPAPFPAISAYAGENTLSSAETVGEAEITGRIKSII